MTTRIFMVRRYSAINDAWTEHQGDFDAVVAAAADKVLDGKADTAGFDVVEMSEVRRVNVRPEIVTITVTEGDAEVSA